MDSNRSNTDSLNDVFGSQQSEIRARKLEDEFNLANKSRVLEQFMKFSKDSIEDILNTSQQSSSMYSIVEGNQMTSEGDDHNRYAPDHNKVLSFHQSWNEFNKQQLVDSNKPQVQSQIMSSCPEIAFKNYKNVFAEITKNVIGEIEDSDSESIVSSNDHHVDMRQVLAELPVNRSNQQYKYSRSNESFDNSKTQDSILLYQEDMNKHFNEFYQKLTTDIQKDMIDLEQPLCQNGITTIEEDFDGENIQSELSTNRRFFNLHSQRKDDQDNSTFRYKRQQSEEERSHSRDHSQKRHTPPLSVFKNNPKSPSPNRYANGENFTAKKGFSNFVIAQNGFKAPVNTTKNQVKYLHLLDNESNAVDFGALYCGQMAQQSIKLYNSNQRDQLTVSISIDNTQHQFGEFLIYDNQNIYNEFTMILDPNQECDLTLLVKSNTYTGQVASILQSELRLKTSEEDMSVTLNAILCTPQLRCLQNGNVRGKQVTMNVNKSKQSFKIHFMNSSDMNLPAMQLEFGFIDLLHYKQLIMTQQQLSKPSTLQRELLLQNGYKMKLKKCELSLKPGDNKGNKYIKVKLRRVEKSQNTLSIAMLVARLKDTDLLYYFTIDIHAVANQ